MREFTTEEVVQEGKTVEERREEARIRLAGELLAVTATLIGGTIVIAALLLYTLPADKFSFQDMLNLILGVSSIFSGLLGAAITFYFSKK